MSELLAPAGSMEALRAAVANGCDAVYLGLQKFGARAYSSNFTEEQLEEAVAYAHLRGVLVYVTVNTIVFQNELDEVKAQLDFLNQAGVDGVIVQDLAVLSYVAQHFQDMEAHCSTQMGIDDAEGALCAKQLGAKRIVVAREMELDQVYRLREQAGIAVEVFVHGALCISYSGNCIMSGMMGNRLGNRGRCIGSCRSLFTLQDAETGQQLGTSYLLSTKDLNTVDRIDQLAGIDSLKIEGRMKEPLYVANVVSRYRRALDGTATPESNEKLNRTFNRSFTKGYLFGEDRRNITNIDKPNNFGYPIGRVGKTRKGAYQLLLNEYLRQNDVIRIRHNGEDVNLSVAKLYDAKGKLINGSDTECFIRVKERLSAGDAVYKTKDLAYEKELAGLLEGEFRRFPLHIAVHARPGDLLEVEAQGLGCSCSWRGSEPLSEARTRPTTAEDVAKQLNRLNDTVFFLEGVAYEDQNAFVPAKMLNAARKAVVQELYRLRLEAKPRRTRACTAPAPVSFSPKKPYLTASVLTEEQYAACRECGIETVYFRNVVKRNGNTYQEREGELLVGGLGGVQHYRASNPFVTDYSLNVVNAESCALLHRLGAKRVTLSYEMNKHQIGDLLRAYRQENGGDPCLEMIVYGHAPLLVTKYCPLKKMDQCGICRKKHYQMKDDHGTFPLVTHEDCSTTVLNGKVLNLLDEMPGIEGMEAFRLAFTTESAQEVARVVKQAQGKLAGTLEDSAFDPATCTRGHFNREIL